MITRWITRSFLLCCVCCLAAACSTPRGSKTSQFSPSQLAKSDVDRITETHQRQLEASLRLLADKLYRRNPREWKKIGVANHEAAVARLFAQADWRLPELGNLAGTEAILTALNPDFTGDRVAAYIVGLGGMLYSAFGEKTEFYMYHDLDPQRLYNAARNVEIAAWKLANSRDANGELLLLANEQYPIANLSFEREFGKMIGNLDLMSTTIADKTNRNVVRVIQNLATAVFLPVAVIIK